jgi:hypothetical protein
MSQRVPEKIVPVASYGESQVEIKTEEPSKLGIVREASLHLTPM